MTVSDIIHKIKRRWTKIRLQPIRVFCFHHVCAMFDAGSMNACDWMQIDEFKKKMLALLQNGVEFISLTEAYHHICNDKIRRKKYAVITFDDGYSSLKEILPWLKEQKIPTTLFLNPAYMDGKHYRKRETERYLIEDEIKQLYMQCPLLTIGSHGWEHIDATKLTKDMFEESVNKSIMYLCKLPNYTPYFAYPYGRHNIETDNIIMKYHLVPLYVSGGDNYNNKEYIDRGLMNG